MLTARAQARRPIRPSLNHKRATSLPLDLLEKPAPPPYPTRRRASFVHSTPGLETIHASLSNVRDIMVGIDIALQENLKKTAALVRRHPYLGA